MQSIDPISALFAKKIGNPTPKPLILAPMAGVTDPPFRRLARRFGADLTVSEMIPSQAMIRMGQKGGRLSTSLREESPLAVQIAGREPGEMVRAAQMNVARGAEIIDINMGCPVKKIIKGGAGAALLKDEGLVDAILEAVVAAVAVPVTVKIRLGWTHDSLNGHRIAQIAEARGVRMIAVHGRTRSQMYSGVADWEAIARIKRVVSIPVIGNGDVRSPRDAEKMLAISGTDGVMIGRGALGNPWLFREVKHYLTYGAEGDSTAAAPPAPPSPTPRERLEVVREHFQGLLDFHGAHTGNLLARKHLSWYSRGLPGSADFRSRVNLSRSPEETWGFIDTFFAALPDQEAA
ncbi:MAG: tRNA dihydrouridine synthase DusB [Magnetococcales bacterium]|nr:tRNA dihydrouridine synthase DusB [Magnetococcales bacterium]